jgi:hypothetical protein
LYLPQVGLAGAGKVGQAGNKLLLTLNVMFAYPESNIGQWQILFQQASNLLYDATEGGLGIGTVNFFNCSHGKDFADIWILESRMPGVDPMSSNIGGLGKKGTHITLFRDQLQRGPFGIVHELGHYLFALYDEYRAGQQQNWQTYNNFSCVSSFSPKACIMGVSGLSSSPRTEFCTAPNDPPNSPGTAHVNGQTINGQFVLNAQQEKNNQACWLTIVNKGFGLAKPTREPSQGLPPGTPTVIFNQVQDISRVVLCIDRSGSMQEEQKMELAKLGAKIFVDLLHEGDQLGIVTFSETPRVDLPITTVTNGNRDQIRNSYIEPLYPGGATAIWDALDTSLSLFPPGSARSPAGCGEIIILLTDGLDNSSRLRLDEVCQKLHDRGIKVFAVGVSAGGQESCDASSSNGVCLRDLNQIVVCTQGSTDGFRLARQSSDLVKIFGDFSAKVRNEDLLQQLAKNVKSGGTTPTVFEVDRFSNETTFSASWEGFANVDLTLMDPNGRFITRATAASDPNIDFFAGQNVQYFRVRQPIPRTWQLNTRLIGGPSELNFIAQASSETREVNVAASTSQQEYFFPSPIRLQTQVDAGYRVAGADVTAQVTRPDRSTTMITLFDDGRPEHGDDFANDGIYAAQFSNYSGNGTYTFDITVRNANGRAITDLPFVETMPGAGSPSIPISSFVRTTSAAAVLSQQPNFDFSLHDRSNGNVCFFSFRDSICLGGNVVLCAGPYFFTTAGGEGFSGTAVFAGAIVPPLGGILTFLGGSPANLTGTLAVTALGNRTNLKLTTTDGRQFTLVGS